MEMIEKIEQKRKEMFYLAAAYGYTAKPTVKCSQELDLLLVKVQKKKMLRIS